MARRRWTLKLDDGVHVVELEHGYWSGRRRLWLDGEPVLEAGPRVFDDGGSQHTLTIGRHEVDIHIRTNGLWFSYRLAVDGARVEPDAGTARLPAAGTGSVAVSSTMEPSSPAREVKRKDRFISFEGWFKGDR
jgi:hypothetical protein